MKTLQFLKFIEFLVVPKVTAAIGAARIGAKAAGETLQLNFEENTELIDEICMVN